MHPEAFQVGQKSQKLGKIGVFTCKVEREIAQVIRGSGFGNVHGVYERREMLVAGDEVVEFEEEFLGRCHYMMVWIWFSM